MSSKKMVKKGYREKTIDGRVYYFSEYSSFSTPHLSKILKHVEKRQRSVAKKPVTKKKVVRKSSTSKAKAPAGASSTPTVDKEKQDG